MLESERKLVDTLVNAIENQQSLQNHNETSKTTTINYHSLGTLTYILVLRVLEERDNGIR